MKNIDPRKYNLSPRIQLQQNSSGHLFIVIDRKSRIIMKDGHRILEMVRTIQLVEKNHSVSVLTSAPVCSKTKLFLNENNIEMNEMG
jgi:hypothetical protein|tara:strand:+ start:2992 stop:3252 length:261 start_codon:yes stop_codon:yes gene_type:complete